MPKKILLFGGSGLLGTELQHALLRTGATVITPTRAEADMSSYASLENIIVREVPDMILNVAALINVNELEKDPLPGWNVNTFGAAAIARILAEHSLEARYFFMSTNYVFGNEKEVYTEDETPFPVNTYGNTKALAERLIAHYFAGRNASYYIIRTAWIYSQVRPTFVDEVVKSLLEGKNFDASTDQFGNLTSASDLADAIVSEFVEAKQKSGIYHMVNASHGEHGVSRLDIASEIARLLNIPASRIKQASSDAVFVTKRPSAVLRNTKLTPMRDWKEALQEYIARHYGQH